MLKKKHWSEPFLATTVPACWKQPENVLQIDKWLVTNWSQDGHTRDTEWKTHQLRSWWPWECRVHTLFPPQNVQKEICTECQVREGKSTMTTVATSEQGQTMRVSGGLSTLLRLLTHCVHITVGFEPPSTPALDDHSRNISITGESGGSTLRRWAGLLKRECTYIESIEVCSQMERSVCVCVCECVCEEEEGVTEKRRWDEIHLRSTHTQIGVKISGTSVSCPRDPGDKRLHVTYSDGEGPFVTKKQGKLLNVQLYKMSTDFPLFILSLCDFVLMAAVKFAGRYCPDTHCRPFMGKCQILSLAQRGSIVAPRAMSHLHAQWYPYII